MGMFAAVADMSHLIIRCGYAQKCIVPSTLYLPILISVGRYTDFFTFRSLLFCRKKMFLAYDAELISEERTFLRPMDMLFLVWLG